MKRRYIWIVLIILIFGLSGCKTMRAMKQSIKEYATSSTPEEQFEDAIENNQLRKAEKIWLNNQQHFIEDPKTLAKLEKITSSIKKTFKPRIEAATTNVTAVKWPSRSRKWTLIRLKLQNAQDIIDEVESNQLLTTLDQIPDGLEELKEKLKSKQKIIKDDASTQFKAYPVLTAPNFFSLYPVKLDEYKFLISQAAFLETTIAKSTGTGIPHLAKTYGHILPPGTLKNLEGHFFRNLLRRTAGNKKPSLRTIIKAMQKAKDMGFPITEVPGCKIAFVRVTSKSFLKDKGIEFGLGFDIDLPVKVEQIEAKSMFNSKTAKDADVVILINETMSKLDRRTTSNEIYKSKYISGYKEAYNNKFDTAMMQLEQHRLKRGELNDRAQMGMMFGLIGTALSIPVAREADREEKRYDEALANATKIPRMIEKPIYDNYQYRIVGVQDTKMSTVQYFIIDRRAKTFLEDVFDIVQQQNFKVAYGVHNDDPKRMQILTSFKTDRDLRMWEKQPAELKLSELLGHYLKQEGKDKKYRNVTQIQKRIMNDRNKALKEFYAQKYGSDTGNDPRFDSVVEILNYSTGSGSGFYVSDDIVVTNSHVVEGSDYAEVRLHNNLETYGKVIALDLYRDLALIKVGVRGKPVRIYSKNTIPSGVTLEVIGHPHGYRYTITRGIFSAYRRLPSQHLASKGQKIRYIQTDAAVNPGNSGGPLFYKNRLVGINTWGRVDEGTSNLNFAVHYSELIEFLNQYGIKYRR